MAMMILVTPMVITTTAIAKKITTAATINNNLDPHPILATIAAIDPKLLYSLSQAVKWSQLEGCSFLHKCKHGVGNGHWGTKFKWSAKNMQKQPFLGIVYLWVPHWTLSVEMLHVQHAFIRSDNAAQYRWAQICMKKRQQCKDRFALFIDC
uniref:Uncharacterized protein n=1 Tax=Romanomermis culicivorax TaxID=13658 RepID=A0A915LBP7_ROMCU